MTSLLFTIHNKLASLSTAEQKIGRYVLDHKHEVIQMSTAELAAAAGVSTATVARFGKALVPDGGFPALKLRLSAESDIDQSLYDEINPQDDLEAVKSKLALRITHTIEETNTSLDDASLRGASRLIASKDDLYVYGLGGVQRCRHRLRTEIHSGRQGDGSFARYALASGRGHDATRNGGTVCRFQFG